MGKGTIISHIAGGQYNVTVNYNKAAITTALSTLGAKETGLIALIAAETDETKKKLLRLQLLSVQKRIAYLNDTDNVPVDANITAWCADLTEDLSGEIGLIEIGREAANGVNIQPGYDANAAYDAARDGQLTPLMAQTAAATFYNLAMLPGTQKWKPTFLYGTITAIDSGLNTCTVLLDAISSSQQALNIVPTAYSIPDVPIEYMDCNAYAFTVGDEVIVKYDGYDPATPKVIGFKESPIACCWVEPWNYDAELSATRVPYPGHPTGSTVEQLSPKMIWVLQDPGGQEPGFPLPGGPAFTISNDAGGIKFYKPEISVPVTYGYSGDEEPSTPYAAACTFPYPTGWGAEPMPVLRSAATKTRVTMRDIITTCRATHFWDHAYGTSVAITISSIKTGTTTPYYFTVYFFSENYLSNTLQGSLNFTIYSEGKYCWADEYGFGVEHQYQPQFEPGGYWTVTDPTAYFAYVPFGEANAIWLDFPFPVDVNRVEMACFVGNREGISPEFTAILDSIEIC